MAGDCRPPPPGGPPRRSQDLPIRPCPLRRPPPPDPTPGPPPPPPPAGPPAGPAAPAGSTAADLGVCVHAGRGQGLAPRGVGAAAHEPAVLALGDEVDVKLDEVVATPEAEAAGGQHEVPA